MARNRKTDPLKFALLRRRRKCIKVMLESEFRSVFVLEYYYDERKKISFFFP